MNRITTLIVVIFFTFQSNAQQNIELKDTITKTNNIIKQYNALILVHSVSFDSKILFSFRSHYDTLEIKSALKEYTKLIANKYKYEKQIYTGEISISYLMKNKIDVDYNKNKNNYLNLQSKDSTVVLDSLLIKNEFVVVNKTSSKGGFAHINCYIDMLDCSFVTREQISTKRYNDYLLKIYDKENSSKKSFDLSLHSNDPLKWAQWFLAQKADELYKPLPPIKEPDLIITNDNIRDSKEK
jgi:hypothetical protein